MSSSSEDSIQSSDFDFCFQNYLNEAAEKSYNEENMSSSSDPSNVMDNIVIKTEIEEDIPTVKCEEVYISKINKYSPKYQARLSTFSKTTINNTEDNVELSKLKNKYIYHLPKSIANYDFNKHKYSCKYRSTASACKKYSTNSSDTNISNARNLSVIIQKKYELRKKRKVYLEQQKENISTIPSEKQITKVTPRKKECVKGKYSVPNRGFVKPMLAVENIMDRKENEDSDNWETIHETDVSSEPSSRLVEQTSNQFVNNDISEINSIRMRTVGSDDGIWDVDKTCSKEVTMLQPYHDANILQENCVQKINEHVDNGINISEKQCSNTTDIAVDQRSENIKAKKNKKNRTCKVQKCAIMDKAKLAEIKKKLLELQAKIPKITKKQSEIPIFKHSLDKELIFELARKDIKPNFIILDTSQVEDIENVDGVNLPHNNSKSIDEPSNSYLPKINKQPIITGIEYRDFGMNTDAEVQTAKVSLLDYQKNIIQPESISEILNTTNTEEVDMEIEDTHKDVAIMVNMSSESNKKENVLADEDNQKSIATKGVQTLPIKISEMRSLTDLVTDRINGINSENVQTEESKNLVENMILNIWEKVPDVQERQKNCFKDSLDYIIEHVIDRYTEKCREIAIEVCESKKKIIEKPTAVKKRICKKKAPAKKLPVTKNFKKKRPTKKSVDINLINNNAQKIESHISAAGPNKNTNNKLYESIELLTQTIKATLKEYANLHNTQKSDKIISKCNENNCSPELFSNTNLSVISNKFSATSTPYASNYSAEQLKSLGIMQKKIEQLEKSKKHTHLKNNNGGIVTSVTPEVSQRSRRTKQATLTQTFRMQVNNKMNTSPANKKSVMDKELENVDVDESMDELCIDMDLAEEDEPEICDIQALLKKVDKWKKSSDPWHFIEYEKPRSFNPNSLITFESTQSSTTQFPCNQEAFKKNY